MQIIKPVDLFHYFAELNFQNVKFYNLLHYIKDLIGKNLTLFICRDSHLKPLNLQLNLIDIYIDYNFPNYIKPLIGKHLVLFIYTNSHFEALNFQFISMGNSTFHAG